TDQVNPHQRFLHCGHHATVKLITRLMNSGRIYENDLSLGLCNYTLYPEPRGLRLVGNRRNLLPHKLIKQSRFTSIRPPDQRNIAGMSHKSVFLTSNLWLTLFSKDLDQIDERLGRLLQPLA